MNKKNLSRREFLKVSGAALGAAALLRMDVREALRQENPLIGRVTYPSVSVFDKPFLDANTVGYHFRDEELSLLRRITPLAGPAYNPVWYQIEDGYVHSAYIQPVIVSLNPVLDVIPETGQLCELTVVSSQPYFYSSTAGWQAANEFKLYFESTHWVTEVVEGPDGKQWYKVADELWNGYYYYVPATHLRAIPDEELSPIHPDVSSMSKRIEISLRWQQLRAYEGDTLVLNVPISSGVGGASTNGISRLTPPGDYTIQLKMPSKHMGNSRLTDTLNDRALPGVPWTMFFDPLGYAIHGTYWHNNFGLPMSAGCVNMRNGDAKWLFCWTTPTTNPGEIEKKGSGTRVKITE